MVLIATDKRLFIGLITVKSGAAMQLLALSYGVKLLLAEKQSTQVLSNEERTT